VGAVAAPPASDRRGQADAQANQLGKGLLTIGFFEGAVGTHGRSRLALLSKLPCDRLSATAAIAALQQYINIRIRSAARAVLLRRSYVLSA
jgi:hypothetical protein